MNEMVMKKERKTIGEQGSSQAMQQIPISSKPVGLINPKNI